jgi:hypothetical protein
LSLSPGDDITRLGGELTMSDDEPLELVTHPEIPSCNANNVCGKQVYYQRYIDVRHTPHREDAESGWVGIFNRETVDRHVSFTHLDPGIPDSVKSLHLIWQNRELGFQGGRLEVFCPRQSVLFLRYGRE